MAPPRAVTGRGRGRGQGRPKGRGHVPSVGENNVPALDPQLEGITEGVEGAAGGFAPRLRQALSQLSPRGVSRWRR